MSVTREGMKRDDQVLEALKEMTSDGSWATPGAIANKLGRPWIASTVRHRMVRLCRNGRALAEYYDATGWHFRTVANRAAAGVGA